jgi:hypothetical protein
VDKADSWSHEASKLPTIQKKIELHMLTIREEQMSIFEQAAIQRFEDEMVIHSKEFSPRLCEILGDEQLRVAIRQAIGPARGYGFNCRGPVRLYIEMMFLFGSGFDTDPQYPWATRILEDQSDDEFLRADRLHASTMTYLERVAGPENEHAKAALHRMKSIGVDLVTSGGPTFEISVLAGMRHLYPEKCEFIGQPALEALIEEGTHFATAHSAVEPADRGLCVGMMFVLGHGFASDPLLRWGREPLAEQQISGPERFMALRVMLGNYLEAIFQSTECI